MVIHVTGRYKGPDYDAVAETEAALAEMGIEGEGDWYRRLDYADEIADLIAAADLVICRAGAGTLTEMAVSGTPTLIVPLPTAAEDHQALNAREMERIGAAQVLYQEAFWDDACIYSGLDGKKLAQQVLALCADEERLQAMGAAAKTMPKANSLELIAAELDGLIAGQHPPTLRLELSPAKSELPTAPNALLRWVQARVAEVGGVEAMEVRRACLSALPSRPPTRVRGVVRNPAGTTQCGRQTRCGLRLPRAAALAATHPHRPHPDRVDEPFLRRGLPPRRHYPPQCRLNTACAAWERRTRKPGPRCLMR